MSHLTEARFNAAKMYCEESLNRVLARIKSINLRKEVYDKMINDFGLEKIQNEISNVNYSWSYSALDEFKRITARINSFFSAIDTYVAYNFDLNLTDYQTAIKEAAELYSVSADGIVNAALATTSDELLKTYIRVAAREKKHNSAESLIEAATEKMKGSKTYQKRALENTKKILQDKNVNIDNLAEETSIADLINKTNQEIHEEVVDKAVRNRVLMAIIKIIKEQGFIVKKENVEECGDHAKIYAIKANGEQADFVVYMDGKFVYKFHEYEGLSCEKDIGSFEEKFESIYGVKLEEKKILWSNPDRLGKMAHQTLNVNKIGG
jgi:hypothetical protein